MIVAGIVTAEIAFWVLLGLALLFRYVGGWRRTGTALLWALPVVDLALLALVSVDLADGARPNDTHALAAIYLGVTVAFGHPIVRWADERFGRRRQGLPPVAKPPKGSPAYVRGVWVDWLRMVLAAAVATAVIAFLELVVRGRPLPSSIDVAAQSPLWVRVGALVLVVVGWFVAGPAFERTRPELRQ